MPTHRIRWQWSWFAGPWPGQGLWWGRTLRNSHAEAGNARTDHHSAQWTGHFGVQRTGGQPSCHFNAWIGLGYHTTDTSLPRTPIARASPVTGHSVHVEGVWGGGEGSRRTGTNSFVFVHRNSRPESSTPGCQASRRHMVVCEEEEEEEEGHGRACSTPHKPLTATFPQHPQQSAAPVGVADPLIRLCTCPALRLPITHTHTGLLAVREEEVVHVVRHCSVAELVGPPPTHP